MKQVNTFFYNIITCFVCCITFQLNATDLYEVSEGRSNYVIKNHVYLSPEKIVNHSTEDILLLNHFLWLPSEHENIPLLTDGDNWLSFEIFNNIDKPKTYYLSIRESVRLVSSQIYITRQGEFPALLPQYSHQANFKSYALSLNAYSKARLYVYLHSDGEQQLNITLMDGSSFVDKTATLSFINGLAIGGAIIFGLMLLCLFLANGSKKVLLLGCYFSSKALLLSVLLGGHLYYLFPYFSELRGIESPILTAISAIFILLFTVKFFQLKLTHQATVKSIYAVCGLLLLYIPISTLLNLSTNLVVSMGIDLFISCSLISLGIILIKINRRLAILYTVIVTIQCSCYLVILFVQNSSLNISYSFYLYSVPFWLNGLLFSFLLSREYYYQIKDRQVEQELAIESAMASQKAQDELLILQEDSQEKLEIRVQERTLELNIALQELGDVNKELSEKNTRDELSGLYNRRFYDQKIMAEYRRSRRNLTPLSLVIIDIDHFKKVNDTHGHLAGDQCIIAVSQKIKQSLGRSSDVACRYGGEEFCLILPETDAEGAIALAEELRVNISASPLQYNNKSIIIKVSSGVSTYKQESDILTEHLFAAADKALYIAKQQGRNQVQYVSIAESTPCQESTNE